VTTPATPLLSAPGRGGIWAGVMSATGYWVSDTAWHRARAERRAVGTCRACGVGNLMPDPTPPAHHTGDESLMVWLSATCSGCGHQVALPNGKTFRGSSAWSRVPRTLMQARDAAVRGREWWCGARPGGGSGARTDLEVPVTTVDDTGRFRCGQD